MAYYGKSKEQLASSLTSLATTVEDSPHPSWFTYAQTIPSAVSTTMSPGNILWMKKSVSIEKSINNLDEIKSNNTETLRLESLYNRTWYIENQKLLRGEQACHPVIAQADNMLKTRSDSYAALDDSICTGETPKRWESQFINFLGNANRSSTDLLSIGGAISPSNCKLEESPCDDAVNYLDDLSISSDVIAAPVPIIVHKPTPTSSKLKELSIFSSATTLLRSRSVSPPISVAINNTIKEQIKAPVNQGFNTINISKLPQSHMTAMQVKDRQNPDVGLRLKFTGFHNTSEFGNDNACAFLGDESSLKNRFIDSHTQSREMGLNRAYSLEQLEEVKHTPFLVEMPLYRDDIGRKDLNRVFDLVTIDSWIVPFIIRCLIVNRELITKLIRVLPTVYDNCSLNEIGYRNYVLQWPILSAWRSLGPVWLSKDPSWRPWDRRIILITDNYLFEVSARNGDGSASSTIIGFACLHGATITNAPCFFQEGEETEALCISCLRTNSESSRKVVFWLRSDDAAHMNIIEREVRLAASMEADSLYEMKDNGDSAGDLLGTGRFNIVRVGRRNPSTTKSVNKMLDSDVNTSISSCSGSSDSDTTDDDDFNIFHSSDLDMPALANESKPTSAVRPKKNNEQPYRALKLVSKPIFRSRVKSGKERGDALVREVVAQILASFHARKLGGASTSAPVVELFGVFETSEGFLLELELMSKVDLFEKISTNGIFSELKTKTIVKQLLVAASCCYSAGIAHRDIKLSNITFPLTDVESNETNLNVKLADFGMAGFICVDDKLRGRCGTPGYVAPDILEAKVNEGYDINVDIFSIGVVAYVLLCGYEPFYGEDDRALIKSNKAVQYQYHSPEWDDVSSFAKDWISLTLKPTTATRMSIKDALSHPWLKDI